MTLLEMMQKRRSVRTYTGEAVTEEQLTETELALLEFEKVHNEKF